MRDIILRIFVVAIGLWIASEIVPGVAISGFGAIVLAAAVLGFLNAIVRPILVVLSLPFVIVTLGLFLVVLNAAMFGLAAWLLDSFRVDGFWSAVLGSLVVSAASWTAAVLTNDGSRRESG